MASVEEIMQLCRLCLEKEQVNIPIFGDNSDIRETFVKISSCLPVKISPEDNLPKKICDGCSYKLDMLYGFQNTSVSSEKQLLQWLKPAGSSSAGDSALARNVTSNPEILVKQEAFEHVEVNSENEISPDTQNYIMQQQKLPYQQRFGGFGESSTALPGAGEPSPKRAKRAAAMKQSISANIETDEDEDDDELDGTMPITKAEGESEDSEVDQSEFVEAASTSVEDQPGPSGLGKSSSEAPYLPRSIKSEANDVAEEECEYICSVCDSTLESLSALHVHFLTHIELAAEDSYRCFCCDATFTRPGELKVHMGTVHHLGTTRRPYACRHCSKCFKTFHALQSHRLIVHVNPRNEPDTRLNQCEFCEKQFKSSTKLDGHLKGHVHNADLCCRICQKHYKTYSEIIRHNRKIHKGGLYVCETCEEVMTNATSLRDHLKIHTGEQPFRCSICCINFFNAGDLSEHLVDFNHQGPVGKSYTCKKCSSKYFKTPHALQAHHFMKHVDLQTKKESVETRCEFCDRPFRNEMALNDHLIGLTLSLDLCCKRCQKHYKLYSGIIRHNIKVHKGRLYVCETCKEVFTNATSLRDHNKIHTGEKPLSCSICSIRFINEKDLSEHLKDFEHERPHQCSHCYKRFTKIKNLVDHIKNLHTEDGVCIICQMKFGTKKGLQQHLGVHVNQFPDF